MGYKRAEEVERGKGRGVTMRPIQCQKSHPFMGDDIASTCYKTKQLTLPRIEKFEMSFNQRRKFSIQLQLFSELNGLIKRMTNNFTLPIRMRISFPTAKFPRSQIEVGRCL